MGESFREKLAAWMIEHSVATGHGDTVDDLLGELAGHIERRERKLAEALKALQQIRDLRCSAFRSYEQDCKDMRAIAASSLSQHQQGESNG